MLTVAQNKNKFKQNFLISRFKFLFNNIINKILFVSEKLRPLMLIFDFKMK